MDNWDDYTKIFLAILVIVNPLGMIPVFLGFTSQQSVEERKRTARATGITVGLVLMGAAICGEVVLRFFGIGIPSFRVGGGILILLVAIDMLHARRSGNRQTKEEAIEAEGKEAVGVVPLGIPLIAGPGAISTVVLYAQGSSGLGHTVALCGLVALAGALTWLVLRLAVPFGRALGTTGINIGTRLMGLILAAIAVEFLAAGLKDLFPFLSSGGAGL